MPSSDRHWLDQVLAAPAIGVLSAPWLAMGGGVWGALDKVITHNHASLSIQRIEAPSALNIKLDLGGGKTAEINPENIFTNYTRKYNLKKGIDGNPEITATDAPVPYNELLEHLVHFVTEYSSVTFASQPREVKRIGVAATCDLGLDSLPPGVAMFLDTCKSPWTSKLRSTNSTFLIDLRCDEHSRDQCHHKISYDSDLEDNRVTVYLDWQRVWESPFSMTSQEIVESVRVVVRDALNYFQNFGERGGALWQERA